MCDCTLGLHYMGTGGCLPRCTTSLPHATARAAASARLRNCAEHGSAQPGAGRTSGLVRAGDRPQAGDACCASEQVQQNDRLADEVQRRHPRQYRRACTQVAVLLVRRGPGQWEGGRGADSLSLTH